MRVLFLAVDPGAAGAVAFACGPFVGVLDLPVEERVLKGKTKRGRAKVRRLLDARALLAELRSLIEDTGPDLVEAAIEGFVTGTGKGKSSGPGQFRSYGRLEGVLASLDVRLREVPAQTWRGVLGLTAGATGNRRKGEEDDRARDQRYKAAKRASLERARALYPDLADRLRRQKDDGRAEALLLLHFLRVACRGA